jgi:hypothetical protein
VQLKTALATGIALGAIPVTPALALDGCKVLLCLSGNWQQIEECRPPIREFFIALSLGKPFPACEMTSNGAANGITARSEPLRAPDHCPPQYTNASEAGDSERITYSCRYEGVVILSIAGQPWSSVYWNRLGDSVTDRSPLASAYVSGSDPRWSADLQDYDASQRTRPRTVDRDGTTGGGN